MLAQKGDIRWDWVGISWGDFGNYWRFPAVWGVWKCISVCVSECKTCQANILQKIHPTSVSWGCLRPARDMSNLGEHVFGWVELPPVFPGLYLTARMCEHYSGFRCFGCGRQLRGNCRCADPAMHRCFVNEVCAWTVWRSLNHHPAWINII